MNWWIAPHWDVSPDELELLRLFALCALLAFVAWIIKEQFKNR